MSARLGPRHDYVTAAHVASLGDALAGFEREAGRLQDWGRELAATLSGGGRLLVAGNGGSAAEAQHLAAELVGKLDRDRRPFSAIALSAETSSLTAIGNDYGFAYCASKFGVVGLTRALSAELAGRVAVTLLIPGGMRTSFFDGRTEQYRPGRGRRAQRPRRRRRDRAVRTVPAGRVRGEGAGGMPGDRAVIPMILALRALGLGDLLTAVPALRALRRDCVGHITLAAPAALAPLVERIGALDRLLTVPASVTKPPVRLSVAVSAPDLAVNLHGRGPESIACLRALGARRLWSYEIADGPGWVDDEHEVRRWCRLVRHYGCTPDPDDLWLAEPGPRDGPVILHPGAASARRQWPPDRYIAVGRHCVARGYQVRVTAGRGERRLAQRVAAGITGATATWGMELGDLADLIWSSPLVVCADTGVAHLATAMQTPSVVLFGSQSPDRWGPPHLPRHRVLRRAPSDRGERPPLASTIDPALLRLRPADVIEAVDDLIQMIMAGQEKT